MSKKVVVMYRVKNEERWIEKSINSILDICSNIVILDDGSTDSTLEICKSFDKVNDIFHQENLPLNESRDRNKLLQMSLKQNPDFILSLDGDEILMPNSQNILNNELNLFYPNKHVFEFQFLTLWDKYNQIRYDGAHSNIWQKRLFRLKDQPMNLQIFDSPFPGNLHCGSIPNNTLNMDSPVRSNAKILHLGKFDQNLRQKKYEWYTKIDPDNYSTDNYQHLINSKGRLSGKQGFEFKNIPDEFILDLV
jgi:O-antigen biosynthesis protein